MNGFTDSESVGVRWGSRCQYWWESSPGDSEETANRGGDNEFTSRCEAPAACSGLRSADRDSKARWENCTFQDRK